MLHRANNSRTGVHRALSFAAAALLLTACAPAPIYKPDASTVTAAPSAVAAAPGNYAGGNVIWGGRIVGVHNFPDHSEIELLGYPLDSSQRPRLDQTAGGRFIALMPGYVREHGLSGRRADDAARPHRGHAHRQGRRCRLRLSAGTRRTIAPLDARRNDQTARQFRRRSGRDRSSLKPGIGISSGGAKTD